jgi:tetratricopeptide (TPR) repeat protein
VTGRSFEENLRTRILEPLGLKNTGLLSPFETVPHMATGYVRTPLGLRNAMYYDQRTLRGAGGMYSTVGDLLTWNLALHAGTLLSPAMTKTLLTPYWKEGGAVEHAYSLSYFSTRLGEGGETARYTSFNGAIEGFCSDVFWFPDTGNFIVILDNSDELNHWRMAPDIYRILRGLPHAMPKPLAADAVARAALTGGPDAAHRMLSDIRGTGADAYEPGNLAAGLNGIGATLLRKGETGAAVTILELSLTLEPNSASAHRRLADAFATQGKASLADEHLTTARLITETETTLMELLTAREYAKADAFIEEAHRTRPGARLLVPSRVGPLFEEVFASGNDADAIALTEAWALANPGEAGAYFSQARVHIRAGAPAKAIECYRKVIEIDPSSPAAASARRAIARLQP